MHFSREEALPQEPRCGGQDRTSQAETQGSEHQGQGGQRRERGEPGSWHRTWGATHLSVKSSGRGSGRRVGEGGMGDGRGELRGVEWVGSPRFWRCWNKSCSSQVI